MAKDRSFEMEESREGVGTLGRGRWFLNIHYNGYPPPRHLDLFPMAHFRTLDVRRRDNSVKIYVRSQWNRRGGPGPFWKWPNDMSSGTILTGGTCSFYIFLFFIILPLFRFFMRHNGTMECLLPGKSDPFIIELSGAGKLSSSSQYNLFLVTSKANNQYISLNTEISMKCQKTNCFPWSLIGISLVF